MLTKAEEEVHASPSAHGARTSEGPPPPYDPVPPMAPSAAGPRTNYVSVSKREGSISGTWTIDSGLQVPEALLAPLEANEERHNLSLRSQEGHLSAKIALLSPGPERASIFLYTKEGGINLAMTSRKSDQPFKARLETMEGSIHIEIPRSFIGPIRHSKNCEFSKEIQQKLQTFSRGSSFVGSLEGSGFSDFETWKGDEIDATTLEGKVNVKYYGEVDTRKRWFFWF